MPRLGSRLFAATFLIGIAFSLWVSAADIGVTRKVADLWRGGRGLDAPRWTAPRLLLKPDLANTVFPAGARGWEGDVLGWSRRRGVAVRAISGRKRATENLVLSVDFRASKNAKGGVFIRVGDVANWLRRAHGGDAICSWILDFAESGANF